MIERCPALGGGHGAAGDRRSSGRTFLMTAALRCPPFGVKSRNSSTITAAVRCGPDAASRKRRTPSDDSRRPREFSHRSKQPNRRRGRTGSEAASIDAPPAPDYDIASRGLENGAVDRRSAPDRPMHRDRRRRRGRALLPATTTSRSRSRGGGGQRGAQVPPPPTTETPRRLLLPCRAAQVDPATVGPFGPGWAAPRPTVDRETQAHGRSTTCGTASYTAVAGLTLGGVGLLAHAQTPA